MALQKSLGRLSVVIALVAMTWSASVRPGAAAVSGAATPTIGQTREVSAVAAASRQYSREAVARDPVLQDLLDALGLQYLHQLDASKVYTIDRQTKEVSVADAAGVGSVSAGSSFFGLGSVVTTISATSGTIEGLAKTVITCPFGAQTASVSGFMASTVSRDPRAAGVRVGTIVMDNFLSTVAQVNFSILKVPGGARNPQNRTVMETTHTGTCGDETKVQHVVATWPPLRIELAVDDTGSMSDELAGVQAALTNFIESHNTDLDQEQRGVSYELISFKDSPTLRLANTEDSAAASAAVNSLFPSGGGDCPEDSLGAVGAALNGLAADEDREGAIVLVTDASPRGGDVGALVAQAKSLGVPIDVMLSGDCAPAAAVAAVSSSAVGAAADPPSARAAYEQLARETGGLFFFRPGGTVEGYTEILGQIFETAVTGGDSAPPTVTVTATPTTIWPPNHRMVEITTEVSAVDDRDPHPVVSLVGVTSTEPSDGQGDGNTEGDVVVTEDGTIFVRAERSGNGSGRSYTITYQAVDADGNVGLGSVDVVVPHNR